MSRFALTQLPLHLRPEPEVRCPRCDEEPVAASLGRSGQHALLCRNEHRFTVAATGEVLCL